MVVPRILLIEHDATARESVGDALRRESMHVEAVGDYEKVLGRYLERGAPGFDLLLLDTDLSGVDGLSLCREMRARTSVPILMLSVRGDETSVIVGLEVGADDYIAKPFNMRELTSRVRAHLRRQRRNAAASAGSVGSTGSVRNVLRFPGLEIDLLRCRVLARGNTVELSGAQFKILALLASHPGRVYNREQIMEPIWGSGLPCGSRAADVHIRNIRQRIEPDPTNPRHILTVRGAGYRFAETGG